MLLKPSGAVRLRGRDPKRLEGDWGPLICTCGPWRTKLRGMRRCGRNPRGDVGDYVEDIEIVDYH